MKETNPDFCTGVQILLSRMESNPEEFSHGDKWYWIMSKVVDAKRNPTHHANTLPELTAEEINALFGAYSPFMRKNFDDSVLREILASEEKELSYSVTSAPPAVLGGTNGGSWVNQTMLTSNKPLTLTLNQQHQAHVNKHTMALHTLGLKEKA